MHATETHQSQLSYIDRKASFFSTLATRLPGAMSLKTNLFTLVLSVLAGVFLLVSGTQGPVAIFLLILDKLSLFIRDALIQTIAAAVALFLIVLSSLGGLTVMLGGYLAYKNHAGTGKLLIGLGAGVGIPWLLFIVFTVALTQQLGAVLAQHSILGWIGIIIAFIARSIAR